MENKFTFCLLYFSTSTRRGLIGRSISWISISTSPTSSPVVVPDGAAGVGVDAAVIAPIVETARTVATDRTAATDRTVEIGRSVLTAPSVATAPSVENALSVPIVETARTVENVRTVENARTEWNAAEELHVVAAEEWAAG